MSLLRTFSYERPSSTSSMERGGGAIRTRRNRDRQRYPRVSPVNSASRTVAALARLSHWVSGMSKQTIHTALAELLRRYNEIMGYGGRGRYSIVGSLERIPHEPRRFALMKFEGKSLVNVSSWLKPMELASYLAGGIDAIESIQRRAARGEIPTAFRIAAAGLSIGFPVPDHTEKEPAS